MKLRLLSILLFVAIAAVAAQKGSKSEKPDNSATKTTPMTVPVLEKAAPEQSDDNAPIAMIAEFFSLLEKGELDDAYAKLMRGSKIAERPEEIRQLKTKTKEAINVFGGIEGFEHVETKDVSTRLLRCTYLSLGKEFPLRWRFYFYRANRIWRVIDLRVDDRLASIFEEPPEPPVPEGKQ